MCLPYRVLGLLLIFSRPSFLPQTHPCEDSETTQENITRLEPALLHDLKRMKHRQVIHPVLQEGIYNVTENDSSDCLCMLETFVGFNPSIVINDDLLLLSSCLCSWAEVELAGPHSAYRPAVFRRVLAFATSLLSSGR